MKTVGESKRDIGIKLSEMAEACGMDLVRQDVEIASLADIPAKTSGCAFAARVYA
jgi:hypothetical protein